MGNRCYNINVNIFYQPYVDGVSPAVIASEAKQSRSAALKKSVTSGLPRERCSLAMTIRAR